VSARAFIKRLWKVILVQEIVVPTENPIRVKPLKSATFKKMKRRPRESDNQNVTFSCPELFPKPATEGLPVIPPHIWREFLRSH
jgi:hypothetical protein